MKSSVRECLGPLLFLNFEVVTCPFLLGCYIFVTLVGPSYAVVTV
jgi:hypothetical protein